MPQYFAKFADTSISLLTLDVGATSAHMTMARYSAQAGAVTQDRSQQDVPLPRLQATLAKLRDHGYAEIEAAGFQTALADSKQTLLDRFKEQSSPNARLVDWAEVSSAVRPQFANTPEEYLTDNMRTFVLHNVQTQMDGDLNIGFDSLGGGAQTHKRNLVYLDGLTIRGNLDAGSSVTTLPQFIHIDGDLHVDNLILTGWVDMVVTGNVFANGVVFAHDGESGGRLRVGGNLSAAAVVGGCMYQTQVLGLVHAKVYWLDDDEPSLKAARILPSSISQADWPRRAELTALADAAYFEDTDWVSREKVKVFNFSVEHAVSCLREGKPLLR